MDITDTPLQYESGNDPEFILPQFRLSNEELNKPETLIVEQKFDYENNDPEHLEMGLMFEDKPDTQTLLTDQKLEYEFPDLVQNPNGLMFQDKDYDAPGSLIPTEGSQYVPAPDPFGGKSSSTTTDAINSINEVNQQLITVITESNTRIVEAIQELSGGKKEAIASADFDITDVVRLLPEVPEEALSAVLAIEADKDVQNTRIVCRFWQNGDQPTLDSGLPLGDLGSVQIETAVNLSRFLIIGVEPGMTHKAHVQYFN